MLGQIASSSRRPLVRLCRQCQAHLRIASAVPSSPLSTLAPLSSTSTLTFRRHISSIDRHLSGRPGHPSYPRPSGFAPRPPKAKLTPEAFLPPPPPTAYYVCQMLLRRLDEFAGSDRFRSKLQDYGIPLPATTLMVNEWSAQVASALERAVDEDSAKVVLAQEGWNEDKLIRSFDADGEGFARAAESAFHRQFVSFASTHHTLPPLLRKHLSTILDATDLTRIAFQGPMAPARQMHRQFHLHIGPTNSGKTYNALKALAKAERGAYAGPLRLLAYEVWERLNLGTVGGLDGEKKECNLITGEERRIVNPNAGLTSCTVEMISLRGPASRGYDVVVIDEIQMLGDTARGGAWMRAVMGTCAKEIHLCGDETTVELLQELIPQMGDELTIHRYDRLTPLAVADKSLEGDWNKVEDGDCVVSFSRNNIFAIKKQIESTAAKKCAVIYGALPPETRADQAKDFNDENGRCKVLVASDAVGMGLNLKIKRIVFESLEKFNGKSEIPLSLTQIKQIAGRAGRFGMTQKKETTSTSDDDEASFDALETPPTPDERDEQSGGLVTTLHKADLPVLRAVLPLELPKIKQATVPVPDSLRTQLAMLLPSTLSYARVLEHLVSLIQVPANMRVEDLELQAPVAALLEPYKDVLTLSEMSTFTLCPVSRRDPHVLHVFKSAVAQYAREGLVEIEPAFKASRFLSMLDLVEGTLAVLPPLPPIVGIGRRVLTPPIIVSALPQLESMHKALIVYLWLSFRLPVAFPERARAADLKSRVEAVLAECLARFPGMRNLKTHERTKAGDRAVADWRKEHVAPNGTRKMPGASGKGVLWVEEAVAQRLRNKSVWQSTGVVPFGRVLAEADGKGPMRQVDTSWLGSDFERQRKMLEDPNATKEDQEQARREIYAIAAPVEGDPVDEMFEIDGESGVGQRVEALPHERYQDEAVEEIDEEGYGEDDYEDEELSPSASTARGFASRQSGFGETYGENVAGMRSPRQQQFGARSFDRSRDMDRREEGPGSRSRGADRRLTFAPRGSGSSDYGRQPRRHEAFGDGPSGRSGASGSRPARPTPPKQRGGFGLMRDD